MEENETEELYEWLDNVPLSRRTGNIARDFSDGVLMAELLKYYYPRYVDLHNYTPACKKSMKIDNWMTLRKKVLNKLKISISKSSLEGIVCGTSGAIEEFLENIRSKIEQGERNSLCGDGNAIAPERSIHGEKLHEKMVPLTTLEKKERELTEKNEAIGILSQKVSHLESLLQLKNQRIKELSMQLQQFSS